MGAVFRLECPKCRYKSEWEMWDAHQYRRIHNTAEEIRNGFWGKELQSLSESEDVFINETEIMFVCDECREIDVKPSLAYKTRIRKNGLEDVLKDGIKTEQELKIHMKQNYTDWVKYKHMCPRCNIRMREIINPEKEGAIYCPECGKELLVKFSGVS